MIAGSRIEARGVAARSVGSRNAGSENFPVASRLLSRHHRGPVMAFYRFARAADDVADDPARNTEGKLAILAAFETGLSGGHGAPEAVALHRAMDGDAALTAPARDLLAAFRQDARGARYGTWQDLLGYCEMSAVPVGRFLLALHGEAREARRYSDPLCIALQVLNHLQDLRQDRDRLGRVYLPADWLAEAGADPADVSRPTLTPALRAVVDRALNECEALLQGAGPLPAAVVSRGLRGQSAATLHLATVLLHRLRAHDPLAGRVTASRTDIARAGIVGGLAALRTPR